MVALPAILTTGQAAKLAKVDIVTVRVWIKNCPELVAYSTPRGKLLYADRFNAFLAEPRSLGPKRKDHPVHEWMRRIEAGESKASIARLAGLSRARISQILPPTRWGGTGH